VWLTKQELDILAKHGVSIVHCPQSNMKLAGGGVMPLSEMLDRKMNVCLGTDSAVSNNALDMFREMHVCSLLHKHHYWDPKVGDSQLMLDMATLNAARAIGRCDMGSIEAGKLADVITLDLNDYKDTALSIIVHSANGMNVSEVLVDGKLLLNDKKFC
jgi:5-methylthioadenosine/S-adenosylhomocysteine deaminase